MKPDIIKEANDIIKKSTECYVGIVDKQGYPNVATRSIIQPNNIYYCYFSTNTSGNLATSIMNNNKGSVCIREDNNNVTLVGTFEIITDMNIKKELWIDWFINYYKQGVKDPEYCIIKFTCERVSLWIDNEYIRFSLEEIKEPQSYCGLLCEKCSFKESHSCGGCIKTKGNPFYGECKIASCCQSKGYAHCGECADMPCKMLYDYSYGDGEHCDNPKGARLELLKLWAKD